jgi:hypothetical protein
LHPCLYVSVNHTIGPLWKTSKCDEKRHAICEFDGTVNVSLVLPSDFAVGPVRQELFTYGPLPSSLCNSRKFVEYTYTAPADGHYKFKTVFQSAGCRDTTLVLLPFNLCNDDHRNLMSKISVNLVTGQVVKALVGGYADDCVPPFNAVGLSVQIQTKSPTQSPIISPTSSPAPPSTAPTFAPLNPGEEFNILLVNATKHISNSHYESFIKAQQRWQKVIKKGYAGFASVPTGSKWCYAPMFKFVNQTTWDDLLVIVDVKFIDGPFGMYVSKFSLSK